MDEPIKPEVKIRKCLKCFKEFKSIGYRICPRCTKSNEALGKWEMGCVYTQEPKKDLNITD